MTQKIKINSYLKIFRNIIRRIILYKNKIRYYKNRILNYMFKILSYKNS